MARKSLGHTKLIWICPNCQTRNPGPEKLCSTCGSPQPEDVDFIQADHEILISNKDEIQRAKNGADIHCPYCGTRNNTVAKICIQCGGKLIGGGKRKSGKVVGAYRSKPGNGIVCEVCGELNKPNAPRCASCGSALGQNQKKSKQPEKVNKGSNSLIVMMIGLVVVIIIGFFIIKGCSTSVSIGEVESTSWSRSVAVEQFLPVVKEDWWENIPSDAYIVVCEERYRSTVSEPEEGSVEKCGTPYTVDEGTGYGEVVQDCVYEVYDTYCEYEISAWEVVETVQSEGNGLIASWPEVLIFSDQRAGEQIEQYSIWFLTDEGRARFDTDDYNLYSSAIKGSEWELTFDGFGNIKTAVPK